MACTFPSSANTVDEWLNALNLARYAPQLAAAGLQVSQLPTITDEQLSAFGVAILGHRKRMLQASKELVVAARQRRLPLLRPRRRRVSTILT